MLRPGDSTPGRRWRRSTAPYNQQQFGGTIGGPLVQDKMFYFGSYEHRRERSEVGVTSPAALGPSVATPADEHQGHLRGDVRFYDEELAGRALQHGALEEGQREPAGSAFPAPASSGTTTSTPCTARS